MRATRTDAAARPVEITDLLWPVDGQGERLAVVKAELIAALAGRLASR